MSDDPELRLRELFDSGDLDATMLRVVRLSRRSIAQCDPRGRCVRRGVRADVETAGGVSLAVGHADVILD
jgi:hypothetical protein